MPGCVTAPRRPPASLPLSSRPISAERGHRREPGRGSGGSRGAMTEESTASGAVDAREELLNECESIWSQMEECQSKITLKRAEPLTESDAEISLLMMRMKALTVEFSQWQIRSPELISTNPEVLLTLGKEELWKVKEDLEKVLLTAQLRNKKIKEDFHREEQWHDEQKKILNALKETEKKMEEDIESHCQRRAFHKLKDEFFKVKAYKEELLNALGAFLEEHFPLPEKDVTAKKKKIKNSEEPATQLIALHEILENLINTLFTTPHEPYITVDDSLWPPYVELLLRCGVALRHPEDPNRIRLEAFHQ
ncbi:centromere protein K isoform X1 [Anas platyrhynchos]|nr:centromere protein K isoform X1 [Anas platyrhynchos]|eukprot:XP_027301880.1 centromere protein K isoform X1 [Anas platyrhynchos]